MDRLEQPPGVFQVIELVDQDDIDVGREGIQYIARAPGQASEVSWLLQIEVPRSLPGVPGVGLEALEQRGLVYLPRTDEDEDLRVQQWLDRPPRLDDLDPTSIPAAHRRFFVEAIEGLISSDGEIAEEERETFEIFKQLLVD